MEDVSRYKDNMKIIKVIVNLPSEQVDFLENQATKEKTTVTDIIMRAIEVEKFFIKQAGENHKILVEDGGVLREVVRK